MALYNSLGTKFSDMSLKLANNVSCKPSNIRASLLKDQIFSTHRYNIGVLSLEESSPINNYHGKAKNGGRELELGDMSFNIHPIMHNYGT